MPRSNTRRAGMTLIEMLAAITVLMMMTVILAQVFLQASRAAGRGKAVAEIYQVDRALASLMAKDFSGATPDFFESRENGLVVNGMGKVIFGIPPGPYHTALGGFSAPEMRRMLMGGSDYIVLSSASAANRDKAVAKVYYVLRETGQFVRIADPDTVFADMDYVYDALEHNVDIDDAAEMDGYEEMRVIAENVTRVKFSFLDKGTGPIGKNADRYAAPVWVDKWEWDDNGGYLPAAVKVELHLVDHRWQTADDDELNNRNFDPLTISDGLRASERFDPEDGEAFTFVVDLPLGTKGPGG